MYLEVTTTVGQNGVWNGIDFDPLPAEVHWKATNSILHEDGQQAIVQVSDHAHS